MSTLPRPAQNVFVKAGITHNHLAVPRRVILSCLAGLVAGWVLASCGGGGGDTSSSTAIALPPAGNAPAPSPAPPAPGTPVPASADISVLFMGNSHTAAHDVPAQVSAMLSSANPGKTVFVQRSPDSMLLNERGSHAPSLALLQSRRWTYVVLQAQDYSSSGLFVYPTTGAERLVSLASAQGSQPVLFAEWPRLGVDESGRIYGTYASVARAQPACLPPIPQSFDLATTRHPQIALHDRDGNHSAPAGAYLAAVMLFATLQNLKAEDWASLPDLSPSGVPTDTQRSLRIVAQDTAKIVSLRSFCGG